MKLMNNDRRTNFSCQNDIRQQRQTYRQYEVQPSQWHLSTATDLLSIWSSAITMTFVNSHRLTVNMKFRHHNDICQQQQTYCQYEVQPSQWHLSTATDLLSISSWSLHQLGHLCWGWDHSPPQGPSCFRRVSVTPLSRTFPSPSPCVWQLKWLAKQTKPHVLSSTHT